MHRKSSSSDSDSNKSQSTQRTTKPKSGKEKKVPVTLRWIVQDDRCDNSSSSSGISLTPTDNAARAANIAPPLATETKRSKYSFRSISVIEPQKIRRPKIKLNIFSSLQ